MTSTTIIGRGVRLPLELYQQLGCPARVRLVLTGNDLLIFSGEDYAVSRPVRTYYYVQMDPATVSQLFLYGTFEATIELVAGHKVMRVAGCTSRRHDRPGKVKECLKRQQTRRKRKKK